MVKDAFATPAADRAAPFCRHPTKEPQRTDLELDAWSPLGSALTDYLDGDRAATLRVFFEDGESSPLPASVFFRSPEELPEAETLALELCRGRVLDIGAGAGCHTLALQQRGYRVRALDICPRAVDVMRRRGVHDAVAGDGFSYMDGAYDTLLLLMNGIGWVGDLAGLDRFLAAAAKILAPGGQILLDSSDLRLTDDPCELLRMATRARQGRYRGETTQQLAYRGRRAAPFGWLYPDADLLGQYAARHGWHIHVAFEDGDGAFLARLMRGD